MLYFSYSPSQVECLAPDTYTQKAEIVCCYDVIPFPREMTILTFWQR